MKDVLIQHGLMKGKRAESGNNDESIIDEKIILDNTEIIISTNIGDGELVAVTKGDYSYIPKNLISTSTVTQTIIHPFDNVALCKCSSTPMLRLLKFGETENDSEWIYHNLYYSPSGSALLSPLDIAFSGCGEYLIVANSTAVQNERLLLYKYDRINMSFEFHSSPTIAGAIKVISMSGDILAITEGNKILLYRLTEAGLIFIETLLAGAVINNLKFSNDGMYIAANLNTSPFIYVGKFNGTTYDSITIDEEIRPTTAGQAFGVSAIAISRNNDFIASAHVTAGLLMYRILESSLEILPFTHVLTNCNVKFDPLSDSLIITGSNTFKKFDYNELGEFTEIDISQPAATFTSYSIDINRNYMVLGFNTYPSIFIYKNIEGIWNKFLLTEYCDAVKGSAVSCMSPDEEWLFSTDTVAPHLQAFKKTGNKYLKVDPIDHPFVSLLHVISYIKFSNDGNFCLIGHTTNPLLSVLKRDGNSWVKLANPSILPVGSVNDIMWFKDDSYAIIGHMNSPFITIYRVNGDTFTKLANPTLPSSSVYKLALKNDDKLLYVGRTGTGYVDTYTINGESYNKVSIPVVPNAATFSSYPLDVTNIKNSNLLLISIAVSSVRNIGLWSIDNNGQLERGLSNEINYNLIRSSLELDNGSILMAIGISPIFSHIDSDYSGFYTDPIKFLGIATAQYLYQTKDGDTLLSGYTSNIHPFIFYRIIKTNRKVVKLSQLKNHKEIDYIAVYKENSETGEKSLLKL
jgi:hypothetical protein